MEGARTGVGTADEPTSARATWSSHDGRIVLSATATSPFWQARIRLPGGRVLRRSTKQRDLERAKDWARERLREAVEFAFRSGVQNLVAARKYTETIEIIRNFSGMAGQRDEETVALILSFIRALTQAGRSKDALRLFAYILDIDTDYHGDYSFVLGTCAISLPTLAETSEALKLVPRAFFASPLGRLTDAIAQQDRPAIRAGYAPYLVASTPTLEYFRQPGVDAFYLKHHLTAQCVPFGRREPDPAKAKLGLSSIAWYGRFGHTMTDYFIGRLYAEIADREVETPEWQGHYFFELDDPFITQGKDRPLSEEALSLQAFDQDMDYDGTNHAVFAKVLGAGPPGQESLFVERRKAQALRIFRIRPYWVSMFQRTIGWVRQKGRTIVALHVRLGDMQRSTWAEQYGTLDLGLYKTWLASVWSSLDGPLLYIASDELDVAKAVFAEYDPIGLSDLPNELPMATHLLDFYVLLKSDVLALSRGTFGSWAAALRESADGVYAPSEDRTALVPHDPWHDRWPS
jgi:hypothetical protein